MKDTFSRIAEMKKIDVTCQIIALAAVIAGFFWWGLFALYVEAAVQVISCCFWYSKLKDMPRLASGTFIRKAMMITGAIQLVSFFIPGVNFIVCLAMLFAGPVLGLAYFVITLKEAIYYGNARKPYYLL